MCGGLAAEISIHRRRLTAAEISQPSSPARLQWPVLNAALVPGDTSAEVFAAQLRPQAALPVFDPQRYTGPNDNNGDNRHVAVLGRLFTHHDGA